MPLRLAHQYDAELAAALPCRFLALDRSFHVIHHNAPGLGDADAVTVLRAVLPECAVADVARLAHIARATGVRQQLLVSDGGGESLRAWRTEAVPGSEYLFLFVTDVTRDVAERIGAEQQLQRQDQLLGHVLGALEEHVVVVGPGGRVIDANPAYRATFGDSASCYGWVEAGAAPRGKASPLPPVQLVFTTGKPFRATETRFGLGGTAREMEVVALPIRDADGAVMQVIEVSTDVTLRRDLERQARHAHKMDAIGNLAAGIAHDFNNILFGVLGFAELVRMDIEPESAAQGNLRQLVRGVERARELVRRIQVFGRSVAPRLARVELVDVVQQLEQELRWQLPANVQLCVHCPHPMDVEADREQVLEALRILTDNALRAMTPDGGVLELNLERLDTDDDFTRARLGFRTGPHAVLTVADSGAGISRADLDRIFDPYFTTREVGAGSGLGLSVAHGIALGHGGAITAYSEPGLGSTFRLYLPLPASAVATRVRPEIPSGTERVLVVDDDAAVAELCRLLLSRLGYRVTARTSSTEALALFRAGPLDFDLVITDQAMPGMDGVELARAILAERPELPILLTTGFGQAIAREKTRGSGIRGVLPKPLETRSLASAVRRTLDGHERASGSEDDGCHESW